MVARTGDRPRLSPLVRKLAAEHSVPLESVAGTGAGGRIRKQDVLAAARAQRAAQAPAIAERMAEPRPAPAQLTTVVEADVTAIARPRDRAGASFAAREGGKLTYLPFIARATAEALKDHPELSAIINDGTVSYHDAGDALFDIPIISQPQVAILGIGAVVRRPVVVAGPGLGEVIAVRSMAYLSLTYDHQLIDGADAARFLATVKARLEDGAFEAEVGR